MQVKQTGNELIISETPGCLWIFGLLFALVGGSFVYGSLGGFTNFNEVPFWQLALACLMGLIAVSFGVWQIFTAPVTKIIFNRTTKTAVYTKYGLNGKTRTFYNFDSIKKFLTLEEKDSEGDSIWSLAMELSSGEIIKISAMGVHHEKSKRDIVFEVNKFTNKQVPTYKSDAEIGDEN